ncbi:hypothetical protein KIPB_014959, partial [Kipferlia bialata]
NGGFNYYWMFAARVLAGIASAFFVAPGFAFVQENSNAKAGCPKGQAKRLSMHAIETAVVGLCFGGILAVDKNNDVRGASLGDSLVWATTFTFVGAIVWFLVTPDKYGIRLAQQKNR